MASSFQPSFPVNANQGYSYVQNDSQKSAQTLYRETTIGKLMIDSLTRYVVGKGLTPMSAPESDLLPGWTPERLSAFRKEAEAYWRLTTGTSDIDYYGKDSFKSLQKIAFKAILNDGDCLRHIGYRKLNNGLIVPYIQLISGRMVSQEWHEDTQESVGGVIISKETGKEIGYCIRILDANFNPTGSFKRVNRRTRRGRLEFDLIMLGKSDPAIVRGIPVLTSLRDDILDYNSYKSNHITQSAVQSLFTAFITHSPDAEGADRTVSFIDKLQNNGAAETNDEGEKKIELGAGYIVDLNDGEDVKLVQSQANGNDFEQFSKAVIGSIASALGMSYEVAMNSYNASFSASRASISGAEKNFAILREEFADKFCTPVWGEIIPYGILMGDIECPEWDSLTNTQKKALLAVTWTGVTPPQVDPTKEVRAYVEAVEAGLCTREYAIRMLYGMDFEEVAERMAEEQNMLPTVSNGEETSAEDGTDADTENDSDEENENE